MNENKTIMVNESFGFVDFMKFFFCLCVIGIHTGIADFASGSLYVDKLIFRLAVPYFFVASGFFFGRKMKHCSESSEIKAGIKKYILRMVKPYIIFEFINLVQACLLMVRANTFGVKSIKPLVKQLIFAPYGALWYVWASIIAILLLHPFLIRKRIDLALFLGIILYGWALLCNSYFFVADDLGLHGVVNKYMQNFLTARNGLFTGFVFIALGIKCAYIWQNWKCNTQKTVIGVIICFLVYYIEVDYVCRQNNSIDHAALFISHIILVPLLFLLTTNISISINKKWTTYMRKLSVGMYFLHMPILWFWDRVLNLSFISHSQFMTVIANNNLMGLLEFGFVALCSFFICLMVYKSKKRPFYNLLQ